MPREKVIANGGLISPDRNSQGPQGGSLRIRLFKGEPGEGEDKGPGARALLSQKLGMLR